MPRLEATIKTRDGLCPASLFTPAEGAGPWRLPHSLTLFSDGLNTSVPLGAQNLSPMGECGAVEILAPPHRPSEINLPDRAKTPQHTKPLPAFRSL